MEYRTSPFFFGRPSYSFEFVHDVLKLLNENWNNRMYTGCIFVDFARAFEMIDTDVKTKSLWDGRYPSKLF